jgi:hypothetical protein
MNKFALLVPLAFGSLAAVAPLSGCSSNQNHEQRESPDAQAPKPDYAKLSIDELLLACIGNEEGKPWLNDMPPACEPDPGSKPVDSTRAERGFQFAWVWNLGADLKGRYTFTYDDNTAKFVVPDSKLAWEPVAYPIPAVSGFNYTHAVRLKGGPFTEYGGGLGQSLRTSLNADSNFPDFPFSAEFPDPGYGAYDLRTWTGVAVWVRRGPQGMSTMRIGVTERNSAEDLNSGALKLKAESTGIPGTGIEENKHCRRWRLCGCAAGTPCSPLDVGGGTIMHACFDPALGTPDPATLSFNGTPGLQVCGETKCLQKNTSSELGDPLFATLDESLAATSATCSLYQTSDGRSDMFCYDPKKDPPPPAKRERCNNPYSFPFTVTTDWQLIKVPFRELLQADEGLVAEDFDLASIKQIVLTHGGGWTDFWIANVGFYKKL